MAKLEKFFDGLHTESRAWVFDHEKAFGLCIRFSEKGFGFGEIVFAVDKETGEVRFDPEAMSMEHCATIVSRLIGTTVLDTAEEEARR